MPTFIKAGYWKKLKKELNGYLNLDNLIDTNSSVVSLSEDLSELSEDLTSLEGRVDNLESVRWDDLRAPASGINPAGQVSPPTVNTTDGSLTFAINNAVCVWFQLPHAWKEGTNINPHVHWSKTTNAAGTVNWQIKYKWFNIGSVAPAFSVLTSGTEGVPNSDTANKHALMEFPDIDGTGKTISSMVCIYLIRTSSGDTYGADVNLYEIDLHYQVDSNGSEQEYIK